MNIHEFIKSFKDISKKVDNINYECGISEELSFNIFTSFSEAYRKENFHSQILKNIFDFSKHGLNFKPALESLCDFIALKLKIEPYHFHRNVNFIIEKGKIDLLIYDDEKAIIIENKINDAVNQPDQLARYYKYVKSMKLDIYSIIYLPKHKGKTPDIDGYSPEFKKFIPSIKEKLICLPAIDVTRNDSLVNSVLVPSIKNETENSLAYNYISQYCNLIKHIGGEIMNETFFKEIIEKIYSNKEDQGIVKNITNAWNEKEKYIGLSIQNSIKEKDNSFKDHEYGNTIYKELDKHISIGYHQDQSIGFVYTPGKGKISQRKENVVKAILRKVDYAEFSTEVEFDGSWCWRYIILEKALKTLEEWESFILKRLMKLESDYRELY